MNFENNLPIYLQIEDYFKRRIITEKLKEGDKLPSVREIARELRVNPNTIQRSYQELERQGLVFTQRGKGTFVTEDLKTIKNLKENMANDLIERFLIDMKELGFTSTDIKEIIAGLIHKEEKE